ncbi:MAG: hypothetical protein NE334_11140 [Lentisphaeraceae bacterium]|nr:hypothetical protein [Lentisphaeraceae bacterium]
MSAHIVGEKIKPYLLDPQAKKKKGNKKAEKKKYEKKIEDVSYIALYFSNYILDKKFKKKFNSVTQYYSSLKSDDKYKDQDIPGNIEFVYIVTGMPTNEKEQKYKFPYINEEKNKNLSSVNRFSPRNGPGLVVVSTSGRIVYRGQPEQVIELLQKLIPVDKK